MMVNDDLCSDEPNAEQNCEASLKDALSVDQNNIDALQSLANLRMVRSKDEEARVHLLKVF
jgi:Tfp pilus assembly protein PilF